jgi:hypothetical protein
LAGIFIGWFSTKLMGFFNWKFTREPIDTRYQKGCVLFLYGDYLFFISLNFDE